MGEHPYSFLVSSAAILREQAQQSEPPYSTRAIVAACFPGALVTGVELPPGVLEMVRVDAEGRPTIYFDLWRSVPEQRVGIAHAVGHLLQDLAPGERYCVPGAYRDPEIEHSCDVLAGELLVPLVQLDRLAPGVLFSREPVARQVFLDEACHLASVFNVPLTFMLWRLELLVQWRREADMVGKIRAVLMSMRVREVRRLSLKPPRRRAAAQRAAAR